MKKINGITILESDEIGEIPARGSMVDAACQKFLISRGLSTGERWRPLPVRKGKRRTYQTPK